MNDSRAALEEAAKKWAINDDPKQYADFYEQESSSLKLLLSAMCRADATVGVLSKFVHVRQPEPHGWLSFSNVKFDSSGIPVITPEIIEALEATK